MSDFMLNVINNYRNYKSVTCKDENGKNREYDLCDSTVIPIGLLRDIAVSETELSAAESKYAWEFFSVYCMYLAGSKIGYRETEEVVSYEFIQKAAVIAKMCMKNGKYNIFERLFFNLLYWQRINRHRKTNKKAKTLVSNDETQRQSRTIPLDMVDQENGELEIIDGVNQPQPEAA